MGSVNNAQVNCLQLKKSNITAEKKKKKKKTKCEQTQT